jgi:hypothetical protein
MAVSTKTGVDLLTIDATNVTVDKNGTELTATIAVALTNIQGKSDLQVFKDGHPMASLPGALTLK